MKLAPFLLLSVWFALPPQAGRPQLPRNESISLDIGVVSVWLGMPKDQALKKFSEVGYKTSPLQKDGRMFVDTGTNASLVIFNSDRLVFADVGWYQSGRTEADAVLGALGALADKKSKDEACEVANVPLSRPDISGNRVLVSCGPRSVLIGKLKIENDQPGATVRERIGYD
jgi:hypothetical protein